MPLSIALHISYTVRAVIMTAVSASISTPVGPFVFDGRRDVDGLLLVC